MRRGCCFGCLGILLLIAGGFFYVGYQLGSADIFTLSPRNDTLAASREEAHVWLRVDPNAAEMLEVFRYGMEDATGLFLPILSAVLPYEASLVFSAAPEQEVSRAVFAMSLRRLGGVLEARSSAQPWRWFAPQRVDSLGLEERGLWVVRSHIPLGEEGLSAYSEYYEPGPGNPLAPEGDHLIEGAMDNRHGHAYLALSALLHPAKVAGDMEASVPIEMSPDTLAKFFALVETGRFYANFTDSEEMELVLHLSCRDETAARLLLYPLLNMQDGLYRVLTEAGVGVEGDVVVEGSAIRAHFSLSDVRQPLIRRLRQEGIL